MEEHSFLKLLETIHTLKYQFLHRPLAKKVPNLFLQFFTICIKLIWFWPTFWLNWVIKIQDNYTLILLVEAVEGHNNVREKHCLDWKYRRCGWKRSSAVCRGCVQRTSLRVWQLLQSSVVSPTLGTSSNSGRAKWTNYIRTH